MSEPLYLKKFNMRSIPIYDKYAESDGKTIVFTGMRESGKTRLVVDFLYHHRDIPYVVCFSPTESLTKTFSYHIPQVFIHYQFSPAKLRNILNRQKLIIDRIKEGGKYRHYDPRVIVIVDDCLKDPAMFRDPTLMEIFLNGRHFRITILITMQYVLGIQPILRKKGFNLLYLCRFPRPYLLADMTQVFVFCDRAIGFQPGRAIERTEARDKRIPPGQDLYALVHIGKDKI